MVGQFYVPVLLDSIPYLFCKATVGKISAPLGSSTTMPIFDKHGVVQVLQNSICSRDFVEQRKQYCIITSIICRSRMLRNTCTEIPLYTSKNDYLFCIKQTCLLIPCSGLKCEIRAVVGNVCYSIFYSYKNVLQTNQGKFSGMLKRCPRVPELQPRLPYGTYPIAGNVFIGAEFCENIVLVVLFSHQP